MSRFRRITSGTSWIPQVDGLRFVAIFSVLILHLLLLVRDEGVRLLVFPASSHWLTFAIENGDRGVSLFFVISGYILARPFLREHRLEGKKISVGAYYLRRLTRLEPPFVLSILLYAIAYYAVKRVSFRDLIPHLFASLAYLHVLIYHQSSTINAVTWSLEIEIQFYLVAPLLGNVYRIENATLRRGLILLMMCVAICVSIFAGGYDHHRTIAGYAQYFLAGFLLADLLELPRHSVRTHWGWDVITLIGWPLVFLPRGVALTSAWLPALFIVLFLAAFYGKASNWFFRLPFVALTGGMCYSIYLMHELLFHLAFPRVKHWHVQSDWKTAVLQMSVLLLVGWLGSVLYFVFVERPCMDPRWPHKLYWRIRNLFTRNVEAAS